MHRSGKRRAGAGEITEQLILLEAGTGERNLEDIAATVPGADHQRIHHVVSNVPGEEAKVRDSVSARADVRWTRISGRGRANLSYGGGVPRTILLGRLATYSYLDMWMAVAQAMVKLRPIIGEMKF